MIHMQFTVEKMEQAFDLKRVFLKDLRKTVSYIGDVIFFFWRGWGGCCTCSLLKFLDQGLNLCHCSDNAGYLPC